MKTIAGALFLLIAEQSYAHANMIQFPNHIKASEVLIPVSFVSLVIGFLLLLWGLWTESHCAGYGPAFSSPAVESDPAPSASEKTK